MPWNDYVFVGTYSGDDYSNYITARTNMDAVIALQELFPDKTVKSFELKEVQYRSKRQCTAFRLLFSAYWKRESHTS